MAGGSKRHDQVVAPASSAVFSSLDAQLASVMEQDGVVLNTPQGVRRKSVKKQQPTVRMTLVPSATQDSVEAMDREVVNVFVGKGTGIPQEVKIHYQDHVRSPYVVSLQKVILTVEDETPEERVEISASHAMSAPGISARPLEAFAAVGSDLMIEADPWMFADQFTAESFDDAYRAVYGHLDKMTDAVREIGSLLSGLFQRAEHVEAVAVEDMREAIGVIEVPRFSFARALAAFAGLAFVVTLPANAISLYHSVSSQRDAATVISTQAIGSLKAATGAGTISQSADELRHASTQFRAVDSMLGDANALAIGVASVLPKEYRSARALTEIGDKASEAGRLLALGFDKVFSDPGRRIDERLDVLSAYAQSSLSLLSDASKAAATVDASSIPESHRAEVKSLLGRLDESTQAVREFAGVSQMLSTMAGKNSLRKYLLIFQNPTELRPTGGFMGSFAEITVDRGAVQDIRVPAGGTYDLKGQLLARVTPPKPLQLVAEDWQFQDANWSPDFPTAAKKIRWFWSKSGQSTVDGVIAVNATFVQHLLDVTGPIDMPEYGKTIDGSNFLLETQKAVELEYDKTNNTPKKFIGDLSAKLVERMKAFQKEDWLKVAALVSDSLETKDIQLALSNPDEEAFAEQYGWNGRLKKSDGDALALVETNIAGQKTDGVISETVAHHVTIGEDGNMTDTVTLTRTHNGKKGDLFNGVRNVSYLRAFVPKGSELVSASGFNTPADSFFQKVDEQASPDQDVMAVESGAHKTAEGVTVADEDGYTSLGGWMQLDPGQTQQVKLSYRLPFTVYDILSRIDTSPDRPSSGSARGAYLLLLTSQSGKTERELTTTVSYPESWNVTWSRPSDVTKQAGEVQYATDWDRDHAVALFFTPPHEQAQNARN